MSLKHANNVLLIIFTPGCGGTNDCANYVIYLGLHHEYKSKVILQSVPKKSFFMMIPYSKSNLILAVLLC